MLLTLAILSSLGFIVAGIAVIVATRPNDFCITRSATIAAPASLLFEQVNDLHNWQAWSPWARMDPNAKNSYEGTRSGVGAVMRWEGTPKVGQGIMTITQSRPDERIGIKLEFLKPFQATNQAEFTFSPADRGTVVTWSMTGKNNFVGKAFSLLMNCDKMVGTQFEDGLKNLSLVVGSEATVKI